ncbi:MAG: hypothetical protein JJK57_05080 [Komagataeibacter hansenii]|uniref:phage baseplate plug family protein n=1 Tax=Novacetimonas hansenii TaxID=436 RepID=UPI00094FD61C|nr:hypothetical protein [Novacetimonas hansenii]MBL7235918.1 hypothetical protein [Novacetimonas hansenii]
MAIPQVIPLSAIAAQSVNVVVSQQVMRLDIRQRATGLFIDISCRDTPVLCGVMCRDRTWIVRDGYFGLPGDFAFLDLEGTSDPSCDGLGGRYVLTYREGQNVA